MHKLFFYPVGVGDKRKVPKVSPGSSKGQKASQVPPSLSSSGRDRSRGRGERDERASKKRRGGRRKASSKGRGDRVSKKGGGGGLSRKRKKRDSGGGGGGPSSAESARKRQRSKSPLRHG